MKRPMIVTITLFTLFTVITLSGCASISEVQKLGNAVNNQSAAINRIEEKFDQLAVNQPAAEPGYEAHKLAQPASHPAATGLHQLTTEEIRGTASTVSTPPTKSVEDRLKNVEDEIKNLGEGILAHTARLAKHEKAINKHDERFRFIDERLKEAGVLKIEKADGWEFGDYESGSAELTGDMKLDIKDIVNGIKGMAQDLEKKGEQIVLVFKSFTDRDGSKELNERLQKDRSRNCQKEFLAAIATAGFKVETRIIPGENSERSITGKYDRYTLVMMKKELNIPLPAAPTAKPATSTTAPNPVSTPVVKPATPSAAPVDPASSATTPEKPEKQVSGKDVDDKNVVASSKMPRLIQ